MVYKTALSGSQYIPPAKPEVSDFSCPFSSLYYHKSFPLPSQPVLAKLFWAVCRLYQQIRQAQLGHSSPTEALNVYADLLKPIY